MVTTPESSFERFYRYRGSRWIYPNYRSGYSAQIVIGVVFNFIALAMFLGGLSMTSRSSGDALMLASMGPGVGGTINLIIGLIGRGKTAQLPSDVHLSVEARKYLAGVHQSCANARMWNRKDRGIQSSPDLSLQRLESGCFQYNRIYAILASNLSGGTPKLVQSAQLAADEALAAILHQCAVWSKFPENSQTAVIVIDRRIQEMTELATRLEILGSRAPTIADRLATSTAMEGVLEELRLTEMAQVELGTSEI